MVYNKHFLKIKKVLCYAHDNVAWILSLEVYKSFVIFKRTEILYRKVATCVWCNLLTHYLTPSWVSRYRSLSATAIEPYRSLTFLHRCCIDHEQCQTFLPLFRN
jgi:hypothetical protein